MKALYISVVALVAVVVLASGAGAAGSLPTWDTVINTPKRFQVLSQFNNEAVLDKETGLVWEKVAGEIDGNGIVDVFDEQKWDEGQARCIDKIVGKRGGWRMPSVQELMSLVDHGISESGPTPPAGHPFSGVQSSTYWSASTNALTTTSPNSAWGVDFATGQPAILSKFSTHFVWCVRSGYGGPDAQ